MNRIESRPAHAGTRQDACPNDVGGPVKESPPADPLAEPGNLAAQMAMRGSYPVAAA